MIGLISIIILFLSLVGMAVIVLRKFSALSVLPQKNFNYGNFFTDKIKSLTQRIPGIKDFSYDLYLQKILSKFRILSLKTESKTGSWLEKLRQKKCQKNNSNHENYWNELKKAKNGK